MHDEPHALDMSQEIVPESRAFARALYEPRDVRDDETVSNMVTTPRFGFMVVKW